MNGEAGQRATPFALGMPSPNFTLAEFWLNLQPGPASQPAPDGAAGVGSARQVSLTWNPAPGATGYSIRRTQDSLGPYLTIGTTTGTQFMDTGLADGAGYRYAISATDGAHDSTDSAEVVVRTLGVPSGLRATPGSTRVSLEWDTVNGAASYTVKRGMAAGGPYTTLGTAAGSPYMDTGRTNGTACFYVVSASDAKGESGNSAETMATPTTGTVTLHTRRLGTSQWGQAAVIAAGGINSPEHLAEVTLHVDVDGGPARGFLVDTPTITGGDGVPDDNGQGSAQLVLASSTTDEDGNVYAMLQSSNVLGAGHDPLVPQTVTLQSLTAGDAALATLTIQRAGPLADQPDTWGGNGLFHFETPAPVLYRPRFSDVELVPLRQHQIHFAVSRVDLLVYDDPDADPRVLIYTCDPDFWRRNPDVDPATDVEFESEQFLTTYGTFDSRIAPDDGVGTYHGQLTVHDPGPDQQIQTIYYEAQDQSTWVRP